MSQLVHLYSPNLDVSHEIFRSQIHYPQQGSIDCGLFALAYATELGYDEDPSTLSLTRSNFEIIPSIASVKTELRRLP